MSKAARGAAGAIAMWARILPEDPMAQRLTRMQIEMIRLGFGDQKVIPFEVAKSLLRTVA